VCVCVCVFFCVDAKINLRIVECLLCSNPYEFISVNVCVRVCVCVSV